MEQLDLFDMQECYEQNEKHNIERDTEVVPEGIDSSYGYKITNENARKLILPLSYTEITHMDFYRMKELRVFNISKNVSKIDKDCFSSFEYLKEINVDSDNPYFSSDNGILYTKNFTRLICCPRKMKGEVVIRDECKILNKKAFYNCKSVTNIVMNENLTKINSYCFENCKWLNSVVLGKNIKEFPETAFTNCENLQKIEISKDNNYMIDEDGVIYDKEKKTLFFVWPEKKGSYKIPTTIKKIYDKAFYNSNLEYITVPKCVDIRRCVESDTGFFAHMENLKAVNFLDKIHPIKESWFNLEKNPISSMISYLYPQMVLPRVKQEESEKVASMIYKKEYTDENWKDEWLKYFIKSRNKYASFFNKNPTLLLLLIREKAFTLEDTQNLIEIANKDGDIETSSLLLEYENENFTSEERDKKLMKDLNENTSSISYLSKRWLYDIQEDGTAYIRGYKGKEEDVIVPPFIGKAKVSYITYTTFNPSHAYNNNVRELRKRVRSIYLPDNIAFDRKAFLGLENLSSFTFPPHFSVEVDPFDYYITGLFPDSPLLTSLKIPEGVKELPEGVFLATPNLENISLPQSLKNISVKAFAACEKIREIEIPSSVKIIENEAFRHCSELRDVTLHEGLERIKEGAFFDCPKITSIFIPKTVKKIEDYAFSFKENKSFTLKGYEKSYAQSYAERNHIHFEKINN